MVLLDVPSLFATRSGCPRVQISIMQLLLYLLINLTASRWISLSLSLSPLDSQKIDDLLANKSQDLSRDWVAQCYQWFIDYSAICIMSVM